MISESKLLEIDAQAEVFSMLTFPAETVKQLLAAARVANAAARVEREERDNPPEWINGEGRGPSELTSRGVDRARSDLARALRLYTAPVPAGVAR